MQINLLRLILYAGHLKKSEAKTIEKNHRKLRQQNQNNLNLN
jgi:hypothetical protein